VFITATYLTESAKVGAVSIESLDRLYRDRYPRFLRLPLVIEHLPSSASSLPPSRIGYFDRPGGATFIEYSTTSRRFHITIEKAKIVSQNVRGLADLN